MTAIKKSYTAHIVLGTGFTFLTLIFGGIVNMTVELKQAQAVTRPDLMIKLDPAQWTCKSSRVDAGQLNCVEYHKNKS